MCFCIWFIIMHSFKNIKDDWEIRNNKEEGSSNSTTQRQLTDEEWGSSKAQLRGIFSIWTV